MTELLTPCSTAPAQPARLTARALKRLAIVAAVAIALLPTVTLASDLSKSYLVVTNRRGGKVSRFDALTGVFLGHLGEHAYTNLDAITFGPDQNLYVAEAERDRVFRYNGSTGEPMGIFADEHLDYVAGLAFGPDGDLYVSSFHSDEIVRFDGVTGAFVDIFVAAGGGGLDGPVYLLFGGDGKLYVGSQNNNQVLRFDAASGAFVDAFVPQYGTDPGGVHQCPGSQAGYDPLAGQGELCAPWGLAFGPDGNLYVASVLNDRILRYDGSTSAFIDAFVPEGYGGLDIPTELAFFGGDLFVGTFVELDVAHILRFDGSTGAFKGVFADEEIASVHGLMFYTWEQQLASDGGGSAVAGHENGDRVVVWSQDSGESTEVFARLYDAGGVARGAPVQVSRGDANPDHSPTVAFHDNGSFVVAWVRGGSSPKLRRGKALSPALSGDEGNAIVGRFFSPSGEPESDEITVVPVDTGSEVSNPDVASGFNRTGVVWEETTASAERLVCARMFDLSANPVGEVFAVDRMDDAGPSSPAIGIVNGKASIVWKRVSDNKSSTPGGRTTTSGNTIVGGVFDSGGASVGGETAYDDGTEGVPSDPDIALDSSGEGLVVWERENPSASRSDVVASRVVAGGSAAGEPIQVSLDQTRDNGRPKIAISGAGTAAVTWESRDTSGESGVFARRLDRTGVPERVEIIVVDSAGADDFVSPDVGFDNADNLTVVFDRARAGLLDLGVFARTTGQATPSSDSGCVGSEYSMCLNEGRFELSVTWADFSDRTGSGNPVRLTGDTGYFWFFNPRNVELIVKVLDGTAINDHYWVFFGALSNVEYTLTVRDTVTGRSVVYTNPAGSFASQADTSALPDAGSGKAGRAVDEPVAGLDFRRARFRETEKSGDREAVAGAAAVCTDDAYNLCLADSRFRVAVDWIAPDSRSGRGRAVPLTGDTGTFWFFAETNVELVVKVLDGRQLNGHFWVFYGALSNIEYTITVTDTETGRLMTYHNTQGQMASVGDTGAF